MEQARALSQPTGAPSNKIAVLMRDNYGIAAQTVTVGTVKVQRGRRNGRREVTPGLIEADPDMRTYATYLVGRYIEWRKKGQHIDGRRFSPGSAHGVLSEGFGSATSV